MTDFITAITTLACLFVAGQVSAADPAPAAPVSEQALAPFELKGVAVGDDEGATKVKLVDADCETLADGTISQCYIGDTTFGGKPAALLIRFLDGKVVYVAATKMTQGDAFDAAEGLKLKFGPPTFMDKTRVTIVRPQRDRSLVFNRPVWDSADGTQQMKVNPAQYTAPRAQFTYAAVVLFDKHLNQVWNARRNNTAEVGDL